jgi:hypothetical protein
LSNFPPLHWRQLVGACSPALCTAQLAERDRSRIAIVLHAVLSLTRGNVSNELLELNRVARSFLAELKDNMADVRRNSGAI